MDIKGILAVLFVLVYSISGVAATVNAPQNNQEVYNIAAVSGNENYASENYIRGDANADGKIDLDDARFLVSYIFQGGSAPNPLEAGDFDQSGTLDISDAVAIIQYVYNNQPKPDQKAPKITVYNPKDGKNFEVDKDEEKEVKFTFKVEDDSSIKSCSLIIDGKTKRTLSNVERNVEKTFKYDLDKGDYDWSIKCEDAYGNVGESEEREFEIEESASNGISYDNLNYRAPAENGDSSGDEIIRIS